MSTNKKCQFLLMCSQLLLGTILVVQASVSLAMDLGPMRFAELPSHPAKALDPASIAPDKIGGIILGSVAEPANSLDVLDVSYDATHTDGRRLAIKITTAEGGVETIYPTLFDWQMVPLAVLALDDSNAIVTLFGELEDPSQTNDARNQGHLIANVHPAVQDTLLGLRLIQADMLLLSNRSGGNGGSRLPIEDIVCDLPSENGEYILDAGETPISLKANKANYVHIERQRDELFHKIGMGRAYVIQDDPMGVHFSVSDKRLHFSGKPIWTYWRYHADSQEFLDQLAQNLPSQVLDRIRQVKPTPEIRRHQAIAIYNKLWKEALNSDEATRLELMPEEESLVLSEAINLVEGANPIVYKALLNTMRYRAFFRYLFQQIPDEYLQFVRALPPLEAFRSVLTPGIIPIGDLHPRSMLTP